jgi:hypothetical protein
LIEQESIRSALGNLIGWLETWRDESGAYNGFVVHRTETKRMGRVHDTAWSQSAMIRGYANLYRKSGEKRWLEAMAGAADLLASRYDPETGRLRNTGHEDDRFQSLVSCALGVCALLSAAGLVDGEKRERYIDISADHIRRYWLAILWVDAEGAFKVADSDFYSPGEDRFIVNFNTMAAEAMLTLYRLSDERTFFDSALRVGRWVTERWEKTQEYNEKILAGKTTVAEDPLSQWMAPGGMSYQYSSSRSDPDDYVTLYTGLSLRGLVALYMATGDERLAGIVEKQCGYLLAMRDPGTQLFYHTTRRGRIEKNPQFVAGAGMALTGLFQAAELIGDRAIPGDTVEGILRRAHANGSYPGFIGKNDTGHPRRIGGGSVWEDEAASVNWNAQLFEYLTLIVEEPEKIEARECDESISVATGRFIYRDSPKRALILSWWPVRSWGIYLYTKKRDTALISFSPIMLYRALRSLWGG